jgi:hypothetical protein
MGFLDLINRGRRGGKKEGRGRRKVGEERYRMERKGREWDKEEWGGKKEEEHPSVFSNTPSLICLEISLDMPTECGSQQRFHAFSFEVEFRFPDPAFD